MPLESKRNDDSVVDGDRGWWKKKWHELTLRESIERASERTRRNIIETSAPYYERDHLAINSLEMKYKTYGKGTIIRGCIGLGTARMAKRWDTAITELAESRQIIDNYGDIYLSSDLLLPNTAIDVCMNSKLKKLNLDLYDWTVMLLSDYAQPLRLQIGDLYRLAFAYSIFDAPELSGHYTEFSKVHIESMEKYMTSLTWHLNTIARGIKEKDKRDERI